MKLRVYNDKVVISGYVNACERISKRIKEHGEEFYEKITEGAFGDAISRNNNIKLLLNHDYTRELASTSDNLEVFEDSIGLFARACVTDEEVVKKARNGELSGWSFGFSSLKERNEMTYNDLPLRSVDSLNLYEVSILDNNHIPAYNSMSLDVRSNTGLKLETRSFKDLTIRDELPKFDNSIFIEKIDKYLTERNI